MYSTITAPSLLIAGAALKQHPSGADVFLPNIYCIQQSDNALLPPEHAVLRACENGRIHSNLTPHLAVIFHDKKFPSYALVSGGIDGQLILWIVNKDDVKIGDKLDLGSPITALISISQSPLVVVGTIDGCIYYIHTGMAMLLSPEASKLSLVVLKKEMISNRPVTKMSYQAESKKLAICCDDSGNVTISCLEPNNMKVIGMFPTPESSSISALAWASEDFKLLIGHENTIFCIDVIGLTFENDNFECMWSKSTNTIAMREIIVAVDTLYTIDTMKRGFYRSSIHVNQINTIEHLGADLSSSATSCLLIDHSFPKEIILGTISGEIIVYSLNSEEELELISTGLYHACAITSLCYTLNGFLSMGMDGTVLFHPFVFTREKGTCLCSTQWDYLLILQDQLTSETVNTANNEIEQIFELSYDNDNTNDINDVEKKCIKTSEMILLGSDDMKNIQSSTLPANYRDKLLLYVPSRDFKDEVEVEDIQVLYDFHAIKMLMKEEYNDEIFKNDFFVNIRLGEMGLRMVSENHDCIIIGSQVVWSLRDAIDDLLNESIKLSEKKDVMSAQIEFMNWNQKLLELRCDDALEECKDWELLRVTKHVTEALNAREVCENGDDFKQIDRPETIEDPYGPQVQKLKKDLERLRDKITKKENENVIIQTNIKEIKCEIDKRERISTDTIKGCSSLNQNSKMHEIMKRKKLTNEIRSREKEIEGLRSQLKALRLKTYPCFEPI